MYIKASETHNKNNTNKLIYVKEIPLYRNPKAHRALMYAT